MLLQETLHQSTQKYPDKTALKFQKRSYTYQEIDQKSNQIARSLKNLGVQRGERVLIYLPNCPEVVLSLYGILKADGIFVIINSETKWHKLIYIINNCTPKVLISSSKVIGSDKNLDKISKDCPSVLQVVLTDGSAENALNFNEFYKGVAEKIHYNNIDIDLAALIYTSGSTGEPKGVMMTHGNILSAIISITTYLKNTPEDVILNVLPLSFDYGLYQVLMAFFFGGTVILHRDMTYIYPVVRIIEEEGITGLPGVPTLFALLLQLKNIKNYRFKNLRYITNTGSTFQDWQIRRLRELWPYVHIYSMYGLTECKRVSYLEPSEIDRRPDSVGKPMPNLEAFVDDGDGNRLPPGKTGELVVRGPSVMQGYWDDPIGTAEKIKPGKYPVDRLLYTGDIFRIDQKGYMYFQGRKDDMLKIKGERVSPREIESVLCQMAEVCAAAVIGEPDKVYGSKAKAFVLTKNGYRNTESIIHHCYIHLESYAVPGTIEFVDDMPYTLNGKIDYPALKTLHYNHKFVS